MAALDRDLLTHDEIEAVLRTFSKRAPTGRRNAALVSLLWRTGLRLGEALALSVKDLDLQDFTVVVQRGKGGKRRVVGLDLGTALVLDKWLMTRRKLGIGSRAPVFCTLQGKPIDQSYVRHMLPRVARKVGIEKRLHAHSLRHRFAVDLVKEGADLLTVRDLLGHASAATSQTYLSRLGASDAVEFARRREWTPNS